MFSVDTKSVLTQSESYRPFHFPWAIETAKKQVIDMTWDVHQIELQDDLRQYNSKDGLATRNFSHEHNKKIVDTLSLSFTEMDRGVAQGYVKLIPYSKNNEVLTADITMAFKETIHQRAYALAAESFGFTDADWVAFKQYQEMNAKIDAISGSEEIDPSTRLGYCKLRTQIAMGEGIGLFGSFTSFLNFKRFGKLMGFNDVNSWSLSDETGHVEYNFRVIENEEKLLSYVERLELKKFTEQVVENYVLAEHSFIDLIGDQEDLPREKLKEYIVYIGKLRLYQRNYLDFKEVPENPLDWMDHILSAGKAENFFEKKVTSYSHQPLIGEIDYSGYATAALSRVIKYDLS